MDLSNSKMIYKLVVIWILGYLTSGTGGQNQQNPFYLDIGVPTTVLGQDERIALTCNVTSSAQLLNVLWNVRKKPSDTVSYDFFNYDVGTYSGRVISSDLLAGKEIHHTFDSAGQTSYMTVYIGNYTGCDENVFKCEATAVAGFGDRAAEATLSIHAVAAKDAITVSPRRVDLEQQSTGTVLCSIPGVKPVPTIQWIRMQEGSVVVIKADSSSEKLSPVLRTQKNDSCLFDVSQTLTVSADSGLHGVFKYYCRVADGAYAQPLTGQIPASITYPIGNQKTGQLLAGSCEIVCVASAIGGAIGGVFLITCIGACCYQKRKKKTRKHSVSESSEEELKTLNANGVNAGLNHEGETEPKVKYMSQNEPKKDMKQFI